MIKRKIIGGASALVVCALLALSLEYSDAVTGAAREALTFCAVSVVPSLFFFAALARILSEVGLPPGLSRVFPLHRLVGLPESAAPVVLCGLTGGLPVGAMLSAELYSRGQLTKTEAARLCAVSSNVSPAFLVGVAGRLFGSIGFGIYLWAAQSIVSLLCGAFLRFLPDDGVRCTTVRTAEEKSAAAVFTSAVSSSAAACVTVTGYIVFFRVLCAIIGETAPWAVGFMSLITEFAGGVRYAAETGSRAACAFAVGLGGISALMQVAGYAEKAKLPLWQTVCVRAVCASVLAGGCLIFGR